MKQYFAKHPSGNVTRSSLPIQETGAESYIFEVDEADKKAVEEGEKDWEITGGKLKTKPSNRKAEQEAAKLAVSGVGNAKKARKLELISKVTEGKATKEEQEEFANLL